jgi:hypothetical protein
VCFAASALAIACGNSAIDNRVSWDVGTASEITVELTSDMLTPKDVDSVRVVTTWPGGPGGSTVESELGPSSLALPARLGSLLIGGTLSAPDAGSQGIVRAEVTVWKAATPFTVLRGAAPVPRTGKMALRMAISWLCAGTATEVAPGKVASTCPEGQSCRAGTCRGDDRSSEMLPFFDQALPAPSCFDLAKCMANARSAPIDRSTCSMAKPSDFAPTNFAVIKPAQTSGVCTPSQCVVPVNPDPIEGWSDDGATISFPAALCMALADGRASDVIMSDACPTKAADASACDGGGP